MFSARRSLARFVVLSGILLTAAPAARTPAGLVSPLDQTIAGHQARLDLLRPPEVRLRKLHLVRPDLIPYPLMYEVVC